MSTRPSDLIRAAHQTLGAVYADYAAPLTLTQVAILRALSQRGALNQTQIVPQAGIDRSTLSTMMIVLEGHGYVLRRRNVRDTRSNIVAITAEGRRALAASIHILTRAENRVMRMIPPGRRQIFVDCLVAVLDTPR